MLLRKLGVESDTNNSRIIRSDEEHEVFVGRMPFLNPQDSQGIVTFASNCQKINREFVCNRHIVI